MYNLFNRFKKLISESATILKCQAYYVNAFWICCRVAVFLLNSIFFGSIPNSIRKFFCYLDLLLKPVKDTFKKYFLVRSSLHWSSNSVHSSSIWNDYSVNILIYRSWSLQVSTKRFQRNLIRWLYKFSGKTLLQFEK